MTSVPRPPTRPLTSFAVLTLDIYGTLIDWETGILDSLEPIIDRLPASHPFKASSDAAENRTTVGKAFSAVERALQSQYPNLKYSALLAEAYLRLAREAGLMTTADDDENAGAITREAQLFGTSVGSWPAFDDTVDAMNRLHKHFKLVPLSNVDQDCFRNTAAGPLGGIQPTFDAVYTAEQIGSYKPSLNNFYYLLHHLKQDFGIEKHQVLHTAQSLTHDHEPAEKIGLTSVWIARGPRGQSTMGGDVDELIQSGRVGFSWRFGSLKEMADAVDAEVAAAKNST